MDPTCRYLSGWCSWVLRKTNKWCNQKPWPAIANSRTTSAIVNYAPGTQSSFPRDYAQTFRLGMGRASTKRNRVALSLLGRAKAEWPHNDSINCDALAGPGNLFVTFRSRVARPASGFRDAAGDPSGANLKRRTHVQGSSTLLLKLRPY